MNNIVNTALIGFGKSGRFYHSPIISSVQGLKLVKIFTRNEDNINAAKRLYPKTEIVQDVDLILNDSKIDLVIIAVPNAMHFELAKKALLANKHVVVDKPFTISTKEADELITLSETVGKILTVYQNRRYDSDFKTVKKLIESGILGNLVEYEVHFDRFRNYLRKGDWKEKDIAGSGILYDLGSHLIDQALCLFGMPTEIFADIRVQREGVKIDDNFEIILYYDKLKVSLKAGMLVKEALPHFILLGDKGSFVKYGMDVQEKALRADKMPLDIEEWGKESEELRGIINIETEGINIRGTVESQIGDYRQFYAELYKAIKENSTPKVTPQQAREVIKIIELAVKSSKCKSVVKVK